MKRVLYLYRVSTKKQLDPSSDKTKADIPLQRKACKEFIDAHKDWVLCKEMYERGVSGYKVSADKRDEIVDIRERLQQYTEQDRIFRETLLHAQKTKEEVLESANREKAIILKEADFKADELVRQGMEKVAELQAEVRTLKLERVRFLQDLDALMARTRRFLQEEAPEMFPPAESTRKLDDREAARLDAMPATPPRWVQERQERLER